VDAWSVGGETNGPRSVTAFCETRRTHWWLKIEYDRLRPGRHEQIEIAGEDRAPKRGYGGIAWDCSVDVPLRNP
jgi:hypothetical protein